MANLPKEQKPTQQKSLSSLEQNINLTTPSLARLRKEDKMMTTSKMLALLTKFSHLLNVDRNMNNNQLIHCAESIVESNEFYMMRLEDFQTCFNLALDGRYGEFYNRLDQPMIFGFLRKYMIERDTAIARKRDTEQNNSIYEVVQSDAVYQSLKEIADKLSIKEVNEPMKLERKQDLGQLLLSEWDKLPTKDVAGIKLKIYNDHEFFAVNDYMSARLMEISDELKDDAQ